jgi:hypothetical protein
MARPKRVVTSDAPWRSGLEERVAQELKALGVPVLFETTKIKYERPAKVHTYTPDFVLPNSIIIETKGYLISSDRQKHLLVKQQHPELDIRFVFGNSRNRINKGSPTTYADWCRKNGFKYADRSIPKEWLDEAAPH